jgi:uncharacterized beta-barrel protein YwiB (DUF1934 family)
MSYIIDIRTTFDVEGELDTMQVTCPAEYSYTPDMQKVTYSEQNDDFTVSTTITITENCVDIERDHPAMPGLHLCVGESVPGRIDTDFCTIVTCCTTERVLSKMRESGGMVFLEYVMDIGGAESHNRVNIKIRKTDVTQ